MKKPFLIFASIVLAAMSYAGIISVWAESSVMAASSTVKLYLSPATAGVTTGYTTALQLRLYKNSSAKVDYAEAHVSFPISELEVVTVSKQDSYFNNGGSPSISYNNSNGSISFMGSGPVLGPVDDVLLATVTFRAKTAGTAAVGYTSASQVGDITNGGHVKNALDARVGATVNISNPIPPQSGNGPSGSSTPAATTSPPPTAVTNPAPATGDAATMQPSQDLASSYPSKNVSAALEQTVTTPPAWLQFLLPAAGGVGLIGMASLGYVLYLKRRKNGVSLPSEDNLGIEVMPSTEAIGPSALFETVSEESLEAAPAEEQSVGGAEPAEDTMSIHDAVDSGEVSEPHLASLESVLAQPAELLPTELKEEAAPYATESVKPELDAPMILSAAPDAPLSSEPSAPSQFAVTSPIPAPVVATVPVVLPTQPSDQAVAPQLVPPQPTTTLTPPTPVPTVDTAVEIDYKNLPDMYEVGAQRLQNEGHNDLAAPVSKAQPV